MNDIHVLTLRITVTQYEPLRMEAFNRRMPISEVIREAVDEHLSRARLAAQPAPEEWPCGNYLRPVTCLTAPSSVTGRCNHCRDLANADPEGGEKRG